MTSPYERPDTPALAALVPLIEGLSDELEAWRRRALAAETALREATERGGGESSSAGVRRIGSDEAAELNRRLARAREQVDLLRTRLRFLEERSEGAA